MRTAGEGILYKWSTMFRVSRTVSVDWQPDYQFAPKFGIDGSLLSIYEENDKLLRQRIQDSWAAINDSARKEVEQAWHQLGSTSGALMINHDPLLTKHYRHARHLVEALQHAETSHDSVDIIDDLVHHLTRLSDGLSRRVDLTSGPVPEGDGPGVA